MTWHDIRESGKQHLLFRYDPERQLVLIRHRGKDIVIDLTSATERLPERHRASVRLVSGGTDDRVERDPPPI